MDGHHPKEFFGFTDEDGVNHYYFGSPIPRKLGEWNEAMFAAIVAQEKERGEAHKETKILL